MPPPQPIQKPKRLLVEGKDQRNFFEAFLDHIHDKNVQVQDFGGVQELRRFLLAFVNMPEFDAVESVGIVRDAEGDANGAWQSVRSALENAKMPVPKHVGQRSVGKPGVSVFILPGNNQPGMLETLLNQTFANDPVNTCIDDFFKCVGRLPGKKIHIPDKARSRAYLWTREKPHVSVGVAAQAEYWDFGHEAFRSLRSFLTAL